MGLAKASVAGVPRSGFVWQGGAERVACVRIMRPNDVNLYLVGFMGTGKTSVSRIVAARLQHRWLDSDHEIERIKGKAVADIFANEGEAAFRAMEREFIVNGHPTERTVVACGGGRVVQPGLLAELQKRGVVICLHATVETILRRTAHSRARPLLNVEDPEQRVRELYAVRDPIYRNAGSVILTDNRPQLEVVQHVLRVYLRDARDFVRARGGDTGPMAGGTL